LGGHPLPVFLLESLFLLLHENFILNVFRRLLSLLELSFSFLLHQDLVLLFQGFVLSFEYDNLIWGLISRFG